MRERTLPYCFSLFSAAILAVSCTDSSGGQGPSQEEVREAIRIRQGGDFNNANVKINELEYGKARKTSDYEHMNQGLTGDMIYPVHVKFTVTYNEGNATLTNNVDEHYIFAENGSGGWEFTQE